MPEAVQQTIIVLVIGRSFKCSLRESCIERRSHDARGSGPPLTGVARAMGKARMQIQRYRWRKRYGIYTQSFRR